MSVCLSVSLSASLSVLSIMHNNSDKSLLKHYVGQDRDKSYNIVSVPAKSGRLVTMITASKSIVSLP